MPPTAFLPNPAEPSFVAFGAVLGGLVGGTIARTLRYGADNRMHWTVEGSYYGTAIAFGAYIAANAFGAAFS